MIGIERFSTECRKAKTKVISLANHNRRRQHNQPIRTQSKYMYSASSAGKRERPSTIGFSLACHWLRKWCELCQPIIEPRKAKPKQSKPRYRKVIGFEGSLSVVSYCLLVYSSRRSLPPPPPPPPTVVSLGLSRLEGVYSTVEPRFNEPLYNEVLGFTNDISSPAF